MRWFAGIVAVALLAGVVYEQIGRRRDRERMPQIGRSVDIGGRSLNIYCSGSGNPPVIFESGGAGPGLTWEPIRAEVAKFTTACWYDRAGEGWSDAGPFPRTSAAIVRDLHELLKRAGVRAPYVLAGASFGGLNSRVYGGMYPAEVAGMVLIDSSHEDEPRRAPKFYLARTAPRFLWHPLHLAFQAAALTGFIRLGQHPFNGEPGDLIRALEQQPKAFPNNSTGMVMPESYAQGEAVRSLGNIPLIVLTAGQAPHFDDPELARQAEEYQQVIIHEIQPKLARLSTRGRQTVVPNSDHDITTHAPDVVIGAIRDVVDRAR
jgi:pimeloyl-ACP methyl ester carboxylesterase